MTPNNGMPGPALDPAFAMHPAAAPEKKVEQPRDHFRDLVETLVFVTMLVLMLKIFVAEAFVIPTGSMAETLLGFQKFVTCADCKFVYPVNATDEMGPQHGGQMRPVDGCTCPNCRFHQTFPKDAGGNVLFLQPLTWPWIKSFFGVVVNAENGEPISPVGGSGDRVLVSKSPFHGYSRWDVVVFKYPYLPQQNYDPQNYIKRLIGLPGETIAIFNGDLYVADGIDYSEQPKPVHETDRWKKYYPNQPWPEHVAFPVAPGMDYTYTNANSAQEAFRAGRFKILRKPPAQILSMQRIVYDNDHQSQQLKGIAPPRWEGDAAWQPVGEGTSAGFTSKKAEQDSWLRYRHYVVEHGSGRPNPDKPTAPEFITNVVGYNMGEPSRGGDDNNHWCGDLILECAVDVTTAQGELIFELSKGVDRFQARFDLATGNCKLIRKGRVREEELATKPTALVGKGKHTVRFANVDDRLTVWVDDTLPFGDGVDYSGERSGERHDVNDKEPASIGVKGDAGVQVGHIKLFRDTYYTAMYRERVPSEADMTMYVQPGHYLCMGDNSTSSSDSRYWGLVPERLMLGRAKLVYFPFPPFGTRAGPIR